MPDQKWLHVLSNTKQMYWFNNYVFLYFCILCLSKRFKKSALAINIKVVFNTELDDAFVKILFLKISLNYLNIKEN